MRYAADNCSAAPDPVSFTALAPMTAAARHFKRETAFASMLTSIFDYLAFTSLWISAGTVSLYAAAALALGNSLCPAIAGLVMAGTLIVYNVDRLRDVTGDRRAAPRRTAFVVRRRRFLWALVAGSALAAVRLAFYLDRSEILLLAGVCAVGLLHRRLKRLRFFKIVYLTASWLAVVVGLPALEHGLDSDWPWAAAVLGSAVFANAVVSSARDREGDVARVGIGPAVALARAVSASGVLLGLVAPARTRLLAVIPIFTLAVLMKFRPSERYGLIVVDGSLLAGGLAATLLLCCRG